MGKIPKKTSRKRSKKLPPSLTELHRSHRVDVKVAKDGGEGMTRSQQRFSQLLNAAHTHDTLKKKRKKNNKSKLLDMTGIARLPYESEEAYVKRAARQTTFNVQKEISKIREDDKAELDSLRDADNRAKSAKRMRRNELKKHETAKKKKLAAAENPPPAVTQSIKRTKPTAAATSSQQSHHSSTPIDFSRKTGGAKFGETVDAPPTFSDGVRNAFRIDSSKKAGSRCPSILNMMGARPSERRGEQSRKRPTVDAEARNEAIEAYRAVKRARR